MTGCSVIETLSELVGSLQKERGRSSLVLSSKGTSSRAELQEQRAISDLKIAFFTASVHQAVVGKLGADVQSGSLAGLAASVREIDRVTKENTRLLEGANDASRALAAETEGLTGLVGSFRVKAA